MTMMEMMERTGRRIREIIAFGAREPQAAASVFALVVLIAASLACVEGGDKAPDNTTGFGTTDASIAGTVNLGGGLGLGVHGLGTLSGARVATDRGEYSTTTASDGTFKLAVAGDKTYNLYVTSNGYKTVVSKGIRVGTGEAKTGVTLTFTQALAAGEKTYVGSSQCKLCHSTQYTRWASSPHRYGISAPGDSPGILSAPKALFEAGYDMVNTSAFSTYGANAPRLSKSGDTYLITIGNVAYAVKYAMGYQWKQRYITQIGEAHYVLPIQYNVSTAEWASYNSSDWYNGTTPLNTSQAAIESTVYKKNAWERKCMGCHSVTGILSLEYSASPTSGITQHRADWLEKGVGCEMCHGPGSRHVWANGAVGTAADPFIKNPSKLTSGQQMDVCGQCHSRGLSVGKLAGQASDTYNTTSDTFSLEYWYNGSRTFQPGDTLVDFYTDGGGYWNDSFAEIRTSKQHHQQWNDIHQSGHTAAGAAISGITCATCHDPHGPVGNARQMKLSVTDNSACLACHGPNGTANQRFVTAAAVTQHTGIKHTTYDPSGTGAGRCVTCHMPYTAKTAVNYDIRSHTFRVVRPHNTYRFYAYAQSETMPNSCQQACHNSGSSLGTSFGTAQAGALAAAQGYDTAVLQRTNVMPESFVAVVRGKVTMQGATTFADTLGVWVTADFTEFGTVTNRQGYYTLVLPGPGTYSLHAVKAGWEVDSKTIVVVANDSKIVNFSDTLNANATSAERPWRCNTCHGGVWGSEWRRSGFDSPQYSEAEDATDLSSGHSLMQASPASGCGVRCHEGNRAGRYLMDSDTSLGTAVGAASRVSIGCMVCHKPHDGDTTSASSALWQFSSSPIDSQYLFRPYATAPADSGSIPLPAPWKSKACYMCHNARTSPRPDGTGMSNRFITDTSYSNGKWTNNGTVTPSQESGPASTPHVGNNVEGFFGRYQGRQMMAINFDSFAGFTPRNSTHSDTNWGKYYSYQAYVYSGGTPKLIAISGAPVVKSDTFTCLSCHMYSQKAGTHGSGTYAPHDGGHTWKPDIRACGVCHDPVYVSINPYTNPLKAGSGDVGVWGTGKWGVNSSGQVLGFDRPVSVLARQTNTGGTSAATTTTLVADAVANDYDGNGVAEGAHTEAENLFKRVVAAMEQGTHDGKTSGIGSNVGLGDTFLLSITTGKPSSPYWWFNRTRALAANGDALASGDSPLSKIAADELRVAYNLVMFDHDETNLGVHNLRFAVETLRAMWTVVGRLKTGDPTWVPPGDDY